jgi:hypothetical protein
VDKLVVARLLDGRLFKGTTSDFHPSRESFNLAVIEGAYHGETITLKLINLKALFFVRTLKGNKQYQEKKLLAPTDLPGQKVTVTFKDNETIRGTATGLSLGLQGFYLFPADPHSNNKRIFIVRSSIRSIRVEE